MLFGLGFLPILTSPVKDIRIFLINIYKWPSFLDQINCIPAKTFNINKDKIREG